jgi:cobalamin biosynthetic protein CobC
MRKTRIRLEGSAKKLDGMLTKSGLEIVGGTNLFRLVRTAAASELFHHLGRAGILVRRFPERADWLRFGLPANAPAWRRLQIALAGFKPSS